MRPYEWRPIGTSDPKRLAEARNQLLSAAQWLARIEHSYAGASTGGGDLRLRWEDDRNVISTHGFETNLGLELHLDDLKMQFTEGGTPAQHEIEIEERSPAHIEAWILIELLHRGVDRDRFSKDLPYDTSHLLSGDAVEFSPNEYEGELAEIASWYRNAVMALRTATGGQNGGAPEDLRILPRDLRVETVSSGQILGFSPGDVATPEPHFYVAALGSEAAPRAVLKASELPEFEAERAVQDFFASHAKPTTH